MINLAHLLTLERPLAVIDAETTGLDPEADRIIQLAVTIHYVSRDPIAWCSLINPEIPIVANVHGITDEMIREAPTFTRVAPALAPKILHVDVAGAHVEFDLDFLRAGFTRAGVEWLWTGDVIDVLEIYRHKFPRRLENALQEFGGEDGQPLPAGSTFDDAHDAGRDVAATEQVLAGQLRRFPELPRTVKALSHYCFPKRKDALDRQGKIVWYAGEAAITFGKFAKNGPCPLSKVDRKYLEYLSGPKTTIDPEVKTILRAAAMGIFPMQEK